MPIDQSDIRFYLSAPDARRGKAARSVAEKSLGGWVSQTPVSPTAVNNLFPDVTGEQNEGGMEDYRCVFVSNEHPRLTLVNSVAWLEKVGGEGGAFVGLGVDKAGQTPSDAQARQAAILKEGGKPPTVAFKGAGERVLLGDLRPGHSVALWVVRKLKGIPPRRGDGFVLHLEGDTLD